MPINARLVVDQILVNADVIKLSDAQDVVEALAVDDSVTDNVFHLLQVAAEARYNYFQTPRDGTIESALLRDSYALQLENAINEIVTLQTVLGDSNGPAD